MAMASHSLPLGLAAALVGASCSALFDQRPNSFGDVPPVRPGAPSGGEGGAGSDSPDPIGAAGGSTSMPGPVDRPPMTPTACSVQPFEQRHFVKRQARRLAARELKATADALLGMAVVDTNKLPPDPRNEGYDNDAKLGFDEAYASALQLVANDFATAALTRLSSLVSCQGDVRAEACVRTLIQTFTAKAFRRALTAAEIAPIQTLYENAKAAVDQDFALKLYFQYVFMSPLFLYRLESGEALAGTSAFRLKGYELASALSYALLGSAPDAELLTAAQTGTIDTVDGLEAQATRLLNSPAGQSNYRFVVRTWLDIKTPAELDERVGAGMGAEFRTQTSAFVDDALANNKSLKHFFTTPDMTVSARLASHYGVPAGTTNGAPFHRFGILGHGSFLASNGSATESSNLIFRGAFISRRLFCNPIPDPPDFQELSEAQQEATARMTIREQLKAHQDQSTSCAGCHVLIDPQGFALERFDHLGKSRTTYSNGTAVDTQGTLVGTDVDGPMSGAKDFSDKLGESQKTRACYALNLMQFAYGHDQAHLDECAAFHMAGPASSPHGMREALVKMVTSDWFRTRSN
jgi:hypothetical protein